MYQRHERHQRNWPLTAGLRAHRERDYVCLRVDMLQREKGHKSILDTGKLSKGQVQETVWEQAEPGCEERRGRNRGPGGRFKALGLVSVSQIRDGGIAGGGNGAREAMLQLLQLCWAQRHSYQGNWDVDAIRGGKESVLVWQISLMAVVMAMAASALWPSTKPNTCVISFNP